MPISSFPSQGPKEDEIKKIEDEMIALAQKWQALHAQREPEEISDYEVRGYQKRMRLSELFGRKEEMILIHNMGSHCRYCTLWGDGINGMRTHLEDRAALIVLSPDSPEKQRSFAEDRGWKFMMYSGKGSNIIEELGFFDADKEQYRPGVSVLKKDGDKLIRITRAGFGPGDQFCSFWNFTSLLPSNGSSSWKPQLSY